MSQSKPEKNLRAELKTNILRSMGAKYSVYIIQVIALMVYSRIFTPEQFGIIATITVFITFFMVFGEAGISSALITKTNLTKSQINDIYGFTLLLAALIVFTFYFFLYGLNLFYSRDDYQIIGLYGLVSIFFNILNAVPLASLLKDKLFFKISKNTISSECIALSLTLILMDYLEPLLLLGIRFGSVAISNFIFNLYSSGKTTLGRPSLSFNLSSVNEIRSFSLYLFGFNFLNYFARNLDNILIGKYIGVGALGVYERSYSLMRYPLQLITFAAAPAVQPVVKEFSENKIDVLNAHSNIIEKIVVLASIVAGLIYCNSDLIVSIVLGEQWEMVSTVIAVLALSIPLQVVTSFNGGFWQALDKTKEQFKVAIFTAIVMVSFISFGAVVLKDFEMLILLVMAGLNITCFNALCQIFKQLYNKHTFYVLKLVSVGLLPFIMSILLYELIIANTLLTGFFNILLSLLLTVTLYSYSAIKIFRK